MELLNFAFRLGVVFAIFGFIWGILQLGYGLLRVGKKKMDGEDYFVKIIKYFFLVEVTFIFGNEAYESNLNQLVITSLILLMYFIGKLQNQQNRTKMFQMVTNGMPKKETKFNLKAEIAIIIFSLGIFVTFMFFPEFSKNPLSIWFHDSIINIEDTPIFGFIFKIIGFIFLVNIIVKMLNAFSFLISGKPLIQNRSPFQQSDETNSNEKKDDSKFDDFEEIE